MRKILSILPGQETLEGAGVKLKRLFSNYNTKDFDPFLLFDHFGSDKPEDYIKGFPWHPHRGIETVTYMIKGEVEHGDSIGNKGIIKSGEVQWMTAGSGIIHQEMPKASKEKFSGFQLWINLPKEKKMTTPRYMDITKFPTVQTKEAEIKIIAGNLNNKNMPEHELFVDVDYFDIKLSGRFHHTSKKETAFVYVYQGSAEIEGETITENQCALLEKEGDIDITGNAKLIFVAGNPLNEAIAWGGPIVMNTQEELQEAFRELNEGTFIKGNIPENVEKNFYKK